jgi:5-methylcytosine-specific restriction endonuclease McrA
MSKERKKIHSRRKYQIQRMLMAKQNECCHLCQVKIALDRDKLLLGWVIGGYSNYYLLSPDRTEKVARATIEHVTPLCKGGTNSQDNLVLFCARCNVQSSVHLSREMDDAFDPE